MATRNTTSPAVAQLTDALETILDLWLDGRLEQLDKREQAAYDKASSALANAETASRLEAVAPRLLDLCEIAQGWVTAWLRAEPHDESMKAFHADLTHVIQAAKAS